jgi:transcriptional regulator with XRE-family HTH domain
MTNKRYSSVSDLVRDVSEDKGFARDVETRIEKRQIIKQLMARRAAAGLSQADIAAAMKCTQSRVSKLENSIDSDLSMSDLAEYADALGLHLRVGVVAKDRSVVDEVKHHAFCIKRLMENLAELAQGDDIEIMRGVANFHGEAFFNLVRILQRSAAKLPVHPETGAPFVEIDMLELIDSSTPSICGPTQAPQSDDPLPFHGAAPAL